MEEVDDLCTRYLTYPVYEPHRKWMAVVIERLKVHAEGHCGAIRIILQDLLFKYHKTERTTPSPDEAMQFYYSRSFLSSPIFQRAFMAVDRRVLAQTASGLLRKVVLGIPCRIPAELQQSHTIMAVKPASGQMDVTPDTSTAIDSLSADIDTAARWLIRHGVVVEHQSGMLQFATYFHRWVWAANVFPGRQDSMVYDGVDQLVTAVLRTFSSHLLDECIDKGDLLQHMFWAGALTCLPAGARVITEPPCRSVEDTKMESEGVLLVLNRPCVIAGDHG